MRRPGRGCVSIRADHVEGASITPVPYLEGWYVAAAYRGRGEHLAAPPARVRRGRQNRAFRQDALNSSRFTDNVAPAAVPPTGVGGFWCRLAATVLLGTCAVLQSGCIYFMKHTPRGACSNDLGSTVRNFCVVAPGTFWRGAKPARSDAEWLINHQVGTIVSLELDVRRAFESARPDPHLDRSVTYFQVHAFSAIQVVTHAHLDDHVALVLAIIKEAPKPVFVNCRAGVDRTAMMAAAYRVLIGGVSPEKAITEMNRFRTPWSALNARYIRSLTGARAAKIRRDMEDWESRLRPSGRFDCRDGQCRFVRLRAELNVKPRRP